MATTSPDPLTTVTAALALCVAPQLALEDATCDLREQAARAGEAARALPLGRHGVRTLRRQLVALERTLKELEEARARSTPKPAEPGPPLTSFSPTTRPPRVAHAPPGASSRRAGAHLPRRDVIREGGISMDSLWAGLTVVAAAVVAVGAVAACAGAGLGYRNRDGYQMAFFGVCAALSATHVWFLWSFHRLSLPLAFGLCVWGATAPRSSRDRRLMRRQDETHRRWAL